MRTWYTCSARSLAGSMINAMGRRFPATAKASLDVDATMSSAAAWINGVYTPPGLSKLLNGAAPKLKVAPASLTTMAGNITEPTSDSGTYSRNTARGDGNDAQCVMKATKLKQSYTWNAGPKNLPFLLNDTVLSPQFK